MGISPSNKSFIHPDFLIETEAAKRLYHEFAKDLPILDYRNHLSPKAISENTIFNSVTQLWLEGDHRSLKNVVKLDNYYSLGQLEHKMKQFVQYYNYERYHESINNLTPSEVYYGTGERKLRRRKRIKQQTLIERKKQNQNIYLN